VTNMDKRFYGAFTLLMLISCVFGFLYVNGEKYYSRQNVRYLAYSLQNAQNDEEQPWSAEKINFFVNSYYDLPENERRKSVIYTGDIPEIGAEYIVLGWSRSGPRYLKQYLIDEYESLSLDRHGYDLMEDIEVEDGK
jgi:hypothetical protein